MGFFDDLLSPVKSIIGTATGALSGTLGSVLKPITGSATKLVGTVTKPLSAVATHGEDIMGQNVKAVAGAAQNTLTPLTSGVGQGVQRLGGGLGSGLQQLGGGIGHGAEDAGKGLGGMFGSFGTMLPIAAVAGLGLFLMEQHKSSGGGMMEKMMEMRLMNSMPSAKRRKTV